MKCLKCNSEILENYIICPGCGTSVEELKNNNLLKKDEVNTVQESNLVNPVLESTEINDNINNQVVGINESVVNSPIEQVREPVQMQDMEQVQNVEQSSILENVGIKENNFNKELKEKSKAPFVIASILIVIILGVIGITGYLFVNSPKKMFSTVITTIYGNYSSVFNADAINATSINNEFDVKFNLKTDDEDMGPIMDIISKLSLNGQTQIDYQNKTASIKLNSKYDNNELVNASAYLKNEKIYVLLEDVYDKYITENVEGVNEIFEYNNYVDDVKIIMDEAVKTLNESLKDEYFTSERVKMDVNGSAATVNKITLLLNYENTKALAIDLLTMLQSNDKFVASYANIMEMEKSEVITEIQEEINSIKDSSNTSSEIIKIIMYTKSFSNQFVGLEVISESDYSNINASLINDKKNIYTILYKEDYKDTEGSLTEDGYLYGASYEDRILTGSIEIVDNKYSFSFGDEELLVKGSVTTSNDGRINLIGTYVIEGTEIGVELSYLTKYNETVNIPNVSNSINFESITDEEGMNIINSLMEKQGVQDLMSEIESLYPTEEEYSGSTAQLCSATYNCTALTGDEYSCKYMDSDGNELDVVCHL